MKAAVAGLLLIAAPCLLWGQDLSTGPGEAARTRSAAAQEPVAFVLHVEAPDEIRTLLERHLELLRYRTLPDLSDSELERLLASAHDNARALVATLGYFSPDIAFARQAADSGAPAQRRLKLTVVPGEPTVVADVEFTFNGPIQSEPQAATQRRQMQDNWSLQPGMRFTQADWDSAKQQALRQLTAQRYPTGHLTDALADIDPESHSAHLSVTLDSGPEYLLGGLVVSGLERYDANLVRRLARLTPGTSYQQTLLVQAQQRLSDSGYFDAAFVALDTAGEPSNAPVQVQLREAKLQKLALGLGASTDGGARVSVEHTHHQVPGIGWRAVSKLLVDRETSSLGTELTSQPNDQLWRWATAAQVQNQKLGSFDVSSQSLRVGRSQSDAQFDQNYYLQYDRANTVASDTAAPTMAQALSANYAFTLRHFDSVPFPNRGWGLGVSLGGGATLGQPQYPYSRMLVRALGYLPLGGGTRDSRSATRAGRLALRAETGAVFAQDAIPLPSTQLFLTGGDNSVRGYGYRDLGVRLPDGSVTAGRTLATASVEWQRPITSNGRLTDWESTVFVDAGAVADRVSALRAKVGVGVGARWKSPIGPLQIDLAYGVETERLRLHLNVGFNF